MRRAGWVGFAVVVTGTVVAQSTCHVISSSLPALAKLWWAFPLAVSIASFAGLLGFSITSGTGDRRKSGFPTSVYLASSPSLAGLNLFSFLSVGAQPPYWVGSAMFFLLCLSSLAYYRITKQSDEETMPYAVTEMSFSSESV